MRIHDHELSNLILRIEQDKDFLPIHSVINLGALRDLVDLRIESSAEITSLRLETARLNIDLSKVNKAHVLEQESLRAKLRDVTADRNNAESEVSRLTSMITRLEEALRTEQDDHRKTIDSAEKAADHIEKQTLAIQQASAALATLTRERDEARKALGRAVQCLINVQDYLRSVGRNFPAAQEIIDEFQGDPK